VKCCGVAYRSENQPANEILSAAAILGMQAPLKYRRYWLSSAGLRLALAAKTSVSAAVSVTTPAIAKKKWLAMAQMTS
jgi:hypothetical protein